MRKPWFVLCVLIALAGGYSATRATEQTIVTFDGAWWTSLDTSQKYAAVEGMIVGYQAGYQRGAGNAVEYMSPSEAKAQGFPAAFKAFSARGAALYQRAMNMNDAGSDRTFGTMTNELDAYFVNQPTRAKELVEYRVWCAITSGAHCKQ